jgi:antitoxin (DNA-binding transcriptional repressor) of toxin-antitoxin stability system
MKTLTVTEVARNFSAVMDKVESAQEEVVLVRNHKPIARLVPEPPAQNALEVLGDLYRTLDDGTADALAEAVSAGRKTKRGARGTIGELRDPWAS